MVGHMQDKAGHSTLEELLASVEADDSLREADGEKEGEHPSATGVAGEGTEGLGALFSNPELLSKLPALLRVVQTMTAPSPPLPDKRPQTPEALLCALRPYLGEGRRQALDAMIRISRLSESLRSLR